MKLLTTSNTKTNKGVPYGYMTYILHLAPYDLSGFNVCPKATPGCILGCLNTSGHGGMFIDIEDSKVQQARIRRTKFFVNDREGFMKQLAKEIRAGIAYATKKGLIPTFRLNGTSDLSWEKYVMEGGLNVFDTFPYVQFYDYTKVLGRKVSNYSNYHLTFSRAENNDADVAKAIDAGMNVAIVYHKAMPAQYNGLNVVNGDTNDLRFLDPKGVVIGLKAKGRARKDASGFVIR